MFTVILMLYCSSLVQDWSIEIVLTWKVALLERKSIWHEFTGLFSVKRYNRSFHYNNQTNCLSFYVLLLQQSKVINSRQLHHLSGTCLLCDWNWVCFCNLLSARFSTTGVFHFRIDHLPVYLDHKPSWSLLAWFSVVCIVLPNCYVSCCSGLCYYLLS